MVKRLPAMWETQVRSLGWEDPLEKAIETLSSILAWEIPWTEEPGGLQSTGSQKSHDLATKQEACQHQGRWLPLKYIDESHQKPFNTG